MAEEIQYYLDTEKRDKEHESSKVHFVRTGIPSPPRPCKYCGQQHESLKELYKHLEQYHPEFFDSQKQEVSDDNSKKTG